MFKPLHNYVLLERINEETTTAGGIIIPDNAREKPSRGRVIATGAGLRDGGELVPISVHENDIVLFAKWAPSANEIKLDGRDYVLIKETDILGIIE
jgi:chaperonin GroES